MKYDELRQKLTDSKDKQYACTSCFNTVQIVDTEIECITKDKIIYFRCPKCFGTQGMQL